MEGHASNPMKDKDGFYLSSQISYMVLGFIYVITGELLVHSLHLRCGKEKAFSFQFSLIFQSSQLIVRGSSLLDTAVWQKQEPNLHV